MIIFVLVFFLVAQNSRNTDVTFILPYFRLLNRVEIRLVYYIITNAEIEVEYFETLYVIPFRFLSLVLLEIR